MVGGDRIFVCVLGEFWLLGFFDGSDENFSRLVWSKIEAKRDL